MAIMKTYNMGDLPEYNMGYGKDAKSPKTADKNVIKKDVALPDGYDAGQYDVSYPKGKSKSGVDGKVFKMADEKDY